MSVVLDKIRTIFLQLFFNKTAKGLLISFPVNKITPNFIQLGKNVQIGKMARIEGIDSYGGTSYKPEICVGDGVSFQQNLHLTCAKRITIGENTAIAANVTVTDIDHRYDNPEVSIEKQLIRVSPVSIGKDCKIYNNAVILPGTVLGDHCVVGANSVVSGKIEGYSVVVGAPAKVVKIYNRQTGQWERK